MWFIALIWIICAVLAYGILLHNLATRMDDTRIGKEDIQWALSWSVNGPFILIVLVLVSVMDGENYLDGFKWVNPVKGFR